MNKDLNRMICDDRISANPRMGKLNSKKVAERSWNRFHHLTNIDLSGPALSRESPFLVEFVATMALRERL